MSIDRFIRWGKPALDTGPPTIERVAQTARDFLGNRWTVEIDGPWVRCWCEDRPTFHLRSEFLAQPDNEHMQTRLRAEEGLFSESQRGFCVFFKGKSGEEQTSVITGLGTDAYTDALANGFTKVIARWWGGEIEWPS